MNDASPGRQRHASIDDGESALAPYLAILAVGVIIGVVVLVYVARHRAEIIAILTQSPS